MAKAAAFTIAPDAPLTGQGYVRIALEGMRVNARIGLHAHEQEGGRRQPVAVNIELFAELGRYLTNPDRESIINYDHLYNGVKSWADRPHTPLIETYLAELTALCFFDPRIQACRVSVSKPDIFPEADSVGVEVYMTRAEFEKNKPQA